MRNSLKHFHHFSSYSYRPLCIHCLIPSLGRQRENMSAEETLLLNLLESYWFEHKIFTPKTPLKTHPSLNHQAQEQEQDQDQEHPKLHRITTLVRKSYSDLDLSSKDTSNPSNSPSPTSVLAGQKLQTILSGKEVGTFEQEKQNKTERNGKTGESRRRRRSRSSSRSLSELEIEELQGFMDMGFVFTHDKVDQKLVSIVPGLQRLVKKEEFGEEGLSSVSRPYLSEAWDCFEDDEKRVKNPLMELRIPALGNEMELKDQLRSWAHTVASTIT